MSWYEKFQPYWHQDTLSQSNGDGGDSSQRVGTFYVLLKILGIELKPQYELSMKAHEIVGGRYRRFPEPTYWGSDPTNFSRDQQLILNLCFASVGDKKRLKESYKAIALRLGFHQNFLRGTDDPTKYWKVPDFITPAELGIFIRGLDLWVLYPVLVFLDFFFVLDLWLRKLKPWDADNMLAQVLFYASYKMPTFWSRLVFHLYGLTDFKERLWEYHCTLDGIKPLHELFISAYDELRSRHEKHFFDRCVIRVIKLFNPSHS